LYPFFNFEFALNLFMSDVGCSFGELPSMSLVSLCFLMTAIWFSYFHPNCLGYAEHGVDETLKNSTLMRHWIYTRVENLYQLVSY